MSYNDGTDERLLKLFHVIYTFVLLTLIVGSCYWIVVQAMDVRKMSKKAVSIFNRICYATTD
jgi:Ni,Fe-hydrogenase I cytochrome b subunit